MARLSLLALVLASALLLVAAPGGAGRPAPGATAPPGAAETPLEAGFAEADITPEVKPGTPVYLAGFGQNRQATGVHDPLKARAVVFRHGKVRVALVSVDLVGLFLPVVERIRSELPGFTHVQVCSTHNHEGPDTMGLWGKSPLQSGIDPDYLARVEKAVARAAREAEKKCRPVNARIASRKAPQLLHDTRKPIIKHEDLVTLELADVAGGKLAGLVVQWNCHPETLDSRNTLISSDFVGPTVGTLQREFRCPVVYLTGTVGGLMTSLRVPIQDAGGKELKDGTFEKTARYGELLAAEASRSLRDARPVRLTPVEARSARVYLPLANKLYLLARQLGVLQREAYVWQGDPYKAEPADEVLAGKAYCVRTEVSYLRLGELEIACIPGEIYPELVLGKVEDPALPGADHPDAPAEPAILAQLKQPHRMVIGLASDEVGYILPKRQWDEKAPFCHGLTKAPYGETNSLGPEPRRYFGAFRDLVAGKR